MYQIGGFELYVLRQNFGPETKVPGLFYCNGLSRQPWNSNDQGAFPETYTDVVQTSLKSMKMGPVLGIRANQLGLSPVFFAVKNALFGVFRGKRSELCENRSEAAIPRHSEIITDPEYPAGRGISGKTDPMCDRRFRRPCSHN